MPIVGVYPAEISTNPANDTTGAHLNQVITITFNEVMNSLTITQESFTLQEEAISVVGAVSYAGTTISFILARALTPNTTNTGTVTPTVKDFMGRSVKSENAWSFTAGGTTSKPAEVDLESAGDLAVAGN